MTTILFILSYLAALALGAWLYAQYHAEIMADLQKAKTEAEFIAANIRAEYNVLADKLKNLESAKPAAPVLPKPPPIPDPPPPSP
jgi:uncharacterized coiled-coil protein SlyX